MVGGTSAPVFSVSPTQVTVIAPAQLQPNTTAQVIVQVGATLSVPFSVIVGAAAPGVFTSNGTGQGQALARREIAQYRDRAEEQAGENGENESEGDGTTVKRDLAQSREFCWSDLR